MSMSNFFGLGKTFNPSEKSINQSIYPEYFNFSKETERPVDMKETDKSRVDKILQDATKSITQPNTLKNKYPISSCIHNKGTTGVNVGSG
jgi:hypothetical protein